ncbi:DUF3087 family protein [Neptuniibacter sp. 2_MG-2023]|uniref:DUF3087 family protein n=1 Tax=Neptuniibacter sp. 2_MG-2023 TaxID=3062671 RepID=UPI0026E29DBC|nr:DUF3087 family protein [Neptuniibacter sp. 2_MG-2023]MDO6513136.1 DUF3087 family protein [Neptuniibacter sp. 2_MG-2023]
MELKQIDKTIYKKKQRKVALILCLIFALIALGLSALLRNYFGNPEQANTMINLIGVLTGALITIGVFSRFVGRPYYDELRYAWNLKRQALKIQNHRHRWEVLLDEGDKTAAIVLAFYYKATLQIQSLEGNDFGFHDTEKREAKFLDQCQQKGLEADPHLYTIDMLLTLK